MRAVAALSALLFAVFTTVLSAGVASAAPSHRLGPYSSEQQCEAQRELWIANPGWTASHCGHDSAGWYFIGRH